MTHYFTIPGLGNSGPEHWQTYFEQSGNNFQRVQQQEWDAPVCSDWIANIDKAIASYDPATVILIGHSLGCLTIAHWTATYKKQIKGALLVAPSDPEAPQYNFPVKGFNPVPLQSLNCKSIVIASDNDPWITIERAAFFANNWGSGFINIGAAGHINAAAGFGPWQQGLKILKTLDWVN